MSPEALALGLLSAVRIAPLAVVSVLLASPRPRLLLTAFVVSGLVVSLVLGLGAVALFEPSGETDGETSATRYGLDVVLGVAALGYAAALGTGRVRSPLSGGTESAAFGPDTPLGRRLRHPTVAVAALAGGLVNLPGLYYLAGLVAILDAASSVASATAQVLVYNLLRFATPVAALVLVVVRPDATRRAVDAARDWLLRHSARLIVVVCAAVGLYLAIRGVTGLIG